MLKQNDVKKFLINKIKSGQIKEIKIYGSSMLPTFSSGEIIHISNSFEINIGDILVANKKDKNVLVVHRAVGVDRKNKIVKLLGDNQDPTESENYKFEDIVAKVVEEKARKKTNLKKLKEVNFIIDIPFNSPKHFNEKTFQIYQSLIVKNKKSFYYDFNIEFNTEIYGEANFIKLKNLDWANEKEFKTFFDKLKLRREILKRKYNLFRFNFGELSVCNTREEQNIIQTIENYKSSIFYNFYSNSIKKLIKKHKIDTSKSKIYNFYISVNNFDKLLSAIIFAKTLDEILNVKPILVNNSTLFNDKFETHFYEKFFKTVVQGYELNRDIHNLSTSYDVINFDKYYTKFKVAPVNIRTECYYKKCQFCDRHSKDNFAFPIENISNKIKNLNSLGVKNIIFQDDCLIPQYMLKLLERLKSEGISIKWQGIFRFDPALNSENTIKTFAENGCRYLFLGLETFSQTLLKKMNKGIEIKNVIDILSLCNKYNIKCGVSLMFGFPGESEKDVRTTYKNVKKYINLISSFEINYFTPTKNCKTQIKDNGKLNYFGYPLNMPEKNKHWVEKTINLIREHKKLDSMYLKNYLCWID